MKRRLILFFSIAVFFIAGYFILQAIVKNKVNVLLEQQAAKEDFTYQKMTFNFLKGNLRLNEVHFSKNGYTVDTEGIEILGFGYYQYLIHKNILIKKVKILKPQIKIHKKDTAQHSATKKAGKQPHIEISQIVIEQGSLNFLKDSTEIFYLKKFTANFQEVSIDSTVLKQKIPFRYRDFDVKIDRLNYELNQLQTLSVNKINLSHNSLFVQELKLIPKYTKQNYTEVISVEEDLMSLTVDSIDIPNYRLSFQKNIPFFESPKIHITGADFDVYRDKTVTDDPATKDLYSKMLRELPVKLNIDSVKINNSIIHYQELIKKDRPPGEVFFTNLHATITQITNVGLERQNFPETTIKIDSDFMGKSSLNVTWQFKINDKADFFTIKGSTSSIPQESINSFFIPAFNMKTEGFVNNIHFNYGGNNHTTSGDFMMKYDNFTVQVLKENGQEKIDVLSWVANILVKKSSQGGEITKHVEEVKRDPTKSFWNYFWNCIQSGLLKVLV